MQSTTPLTPQERQRLGRVSAAWGVWSIAANWGHIALCFALFLFTPLPWRWVLYPVLVVWQARNLNGLAILVHEAIHGVLLPGGLEHSETLSELPTKAGDTGGQRPRMAVSAAGEAWPGLAQKTSLHLKPGSKQPLPGRAEPCGVVRQFSRRKPPNQPKKKGRLFARCYPVRSIIPKKYKFDLNAWAGRWLCGFPMLVSPWAYHQLHTAHHLGVHTPGDPDLPHYQGLPAPRGVLARRLLGDFMGGKSLKKYLSLLLPGTSGPAARNPELAPMLALHGAAWLALWWLGWWPVAVLLWVVPMATVMPVFFRLRAAMEHGGMAAHGPLYSRTTLGNPFSRFWFSPHHSHFHFEHHLCPWTPHYHLAALHRLLREKGVLPAAALSPGYTATWRRLVATPGPPAKNAP